jgi:hypothetical protein
MAYSIWGNRLSASKEICGLYLSQNVKQQVNEEGTCTFALCETLSFIDTSTKDQSSRPFALHEVVRVVENHLLDQNGNPRADLL